MTKPKLTYFDAPVSRGEECRLALFVAGVSFEDDRVKQDQWAAVKAASPYGAVPVFTMPGHPPLAHSTAIMTLIGREWGLHPTDNFEAARHEGVMAYVEEMRHHVAPTMAIKDAVEKKAARETLASGYLQTWGANLEKQIVDGPFLAGAKLNVADIKLYMGVRWFKSGVLDHVPGTVFDAFPKLTRHHDAVANDARIAAWRAKF
ncbi:MAG TPA: glutathione S-transferase [Kofleriaceae bacterium]|jgi:glutathione S-transferase